MPRPSALFGEAHLRQILSSYAVYNNEVRTHMALRKDAPLGRRVQQSGVRLMMSRGERNNCTVAISTCRSYLTLFHTATVRASCPSFGFLLIAVVMVNVSPSSL